MAELLHQSDESIGNLAESSRRVGGETVVENGSQVTGKGFAKARLDVGLGLPKLVGIECGKAGGIAAREEVDEGHQKRQRLLCGLHVFSATHGLRLLENVRVERLNPVVATGILIAHLLFNASVLKNVEKRMVKDRIVTLLRLHVERRVTHVTAFVQQIAIDHRRINVRLGEGGKDDAFAVGIGFFALKGDLNPELLAKRRSNDGKCGADRTIGNRHGVASKKKGTPCLAGHDVPKER